jgi:hypothetical protein
MMRSPVGLRNYRLSYDGKELTMYGLLLELATSVPIAGLFAYFLSLDLTKRTNGGRTKPLTRNEIVGKAKSDAFTMSFIVVLVQVGIYLKYH